MQIRTIPYQYIKTLIKHVFLLNFTYELLMSFRIYFYPSHARQGDNLLLLTWLQAECLEDDNIHRECGREGDQ